MLSAGHACVDVYQGAVASLVPFFLAERAYGYAAVSGIVLAASLLSSVAQPLFGVLTDRRAVPWLLPLSTVLGGLGIALSGLSGSYALTLAFVALSGIGVAAYHPESARVARLVSGGSHTAMGWFSLGGNLGFAAAPLMVTTVVASGGLRLTPLLAVPALAGSVLCLPVLREVGRTVRVGTGTGAAAGADDVASFVRLSLAVVCRSVVFIGLSTFISSYARQRGEAVGAAAREAVRRRAPRRSSCSTSVARWDPCWAAGWPTAGAGSRSPVGRTCSRSVPWRGSCWYPVRRSTCAWRWPPSACTSPSRCRSPSARTTCPPASAPPAGSPSG